VASASRRSIFLGQPSLDDVETNHAGPGNTVLYCIDGEVHMLKRIRVCSEMQELKKKKRRMVKFGLQPVDEDKGLDLEVMQGLKPKLLSIINH
jgi:hypothetical protein